MVLRRLFGNLHFRQHWFHISNSRHNLALSILPQSFFRLRSVGLVDQVEQESSIVEDVNDICRVLSDFRGPHHDIESALNGFSGKISVDVVEQVLKRCRNLGVSAHRFFLWVGKLPGFSHSRIGYHILVDILGSCKEFPLVWDFLLEMRDSKREIRPEIFWIIFRSYCRAHLPADAERAFKKMEEFGVKPDIEDFHQLLTSLCQNNFVNEAQEIFEKWKSDFDICPKTYSILMKGWGNFSNSDESRKLFDGMLKRCTPDVIAYNTLMGCLCQSGKVNEAYEVFREMRHHGFHPNAASYAVFLRASCEANDVHSAVKILERMRRYNLVPNVFTYNCIIKLFCKREKVDEAYGLLDEMIERGLQPDSWSFNTILAVHCQLCEVKKAHRLLSRMDGNSCLPDKHTYNMLLKMLINVGRTDRAMEVWEGMGGRGFYPAVSTYAVMIQGLCRKRGRIEDACRYFEMMVDEGIPPYLNTCELLRNCLLHLRMRERVHVLAIKMQQSTSCTIQELSNVMVNKSMILSKKNDF
uniref:Pentatricopeptide repeat-containing protein At1g52640, mitochondrial n=1 Tax=Anthurium amnicola TaxID=1678845 RepID=A0A1D1XQE5_9ARAE